MVAGPDGRLADAAQVKVLLTVVLAPSTVLYEAVVVLHVDTFLLQSMDMFATEQFAFVERVDEKLA